MSLTEYGREPHTRKAYVHQPALLLVGVDVSKAKHHAGIGTPTTMSCRKLAFTHTREGFQRFAQARTAPLVNHGRQRILIARAHRPVSPGRAGYGLIFLVYVPDASTFAPNRHRRNCVTTTWLG